MPPAARTACQGCGGRGRGEPGGYRDGESVRVCGGLGSPLAAGLVGGPEHMSRHKHFSTSRQGREDSRPRIRRVEPPFGAKHAAAPASRTAWAFGRPDSGWWWPWNLIDRPVAALAAPGSGVESRARAPKSSGVGEEGQIHSLVCRSPASSTAARGRTYTLWGFDAKGARKGAPGRPRRGFG